MLILIIQGAQPQRNRCSTPPVAVFNSSGRDAQSGAEYSNSGEYEFLFNRDTRFKVHGIKTNASGRITELVLEAVPTKKKR